MSYILEALRRAERERDTGKAPSVESLNRSVVEVDRTRVPPSVWLLAIGTAVIAGAALAVLLWPHAPARAPASAPLEASPAPRPAAVPARAPTPAEPIPAQAATATPTAIEDRDDVISLDDVTGDPVDASVAVDANEPAPTAALPIEPEDTAANPAPAPPVATAVPTASTPDAHHAAIMVPAGVTVLREMPASYREQFPVQTLDVHVYNPDPAKRWIMIAGQRYREGETIASGPQIVQIIEAGVVFDYQGARVLLPVR